MSVWNVFHADLVYYPQSPPTDSYCCAIPKNTRLSDITIFTSCKANTNSAEPGQASLKSTDGGSLGTNLRHPYTVSDTGDCTFSVLMNEDYVLDCCLDKQARIRWCTRPMSQDGALSYKCAESMVRVMICSPMPGMDFAPVGARAGHISQASSRIPVTPAKVGLNIIPPCDFFTINNPPRTQAIFRTTNLSIHLYNPLPKSSNFHRYAILHFHPVRLCCPGDRRPRAETSCTSSSSSAGMAVSYLFPNTCVYRMSVCTSPRRLSAEYTNVEWVVRTSRCTDRSAD